MVTEFHCDPHTGGLGRVQLTPVGPGLAPTDPRQGEDGLHAEVGQAGHGHAHPARLVVVDHPLVVEPEKNNISHELSPVYRNCCRAFLFSREN